MFPKQPRTIKENICIVASGTIAEGESVLIQYSPDMGVTWKDLLLNGVTQGITKCPFSFESGLFVLFLLFYLYAYGILYKRDQFGGT